jgi:DNA-binding transcriptional MerR regulator
MAGKSPEAFRTISEVADWLDRPAHVLRFWESKFPQIKPVKRAGGRRYYRPEDMLLLGGIKKLLHDDGMTIKGAQKLLRDQGIRHVSGMSQPLDEDTAALVGDVSGAPEQATVVPEAYDAGLVNDADQGDDVFADAKEALDLFDAPAPAPAPAPNPAPAPITASRQDAPAPAPLVPSQPAPLGADLPPPPDLDLIQPEPGILSAIAARRQPFAAADRAALWPILARLDALAARLSDAHKS